MSRKEIAVAMVAAVMALSAGAAHAGGRSKDDRVNFYRTLHESAQPWKALFGMSPAPTAPVVAQPAAKPATPAKR
ncbi:hypothetical protein [Ancylobacter pratisalsi]|uniref:Uncharacterized protein n=1 Tax=Ancylobacter pratisalsi TaxID=1745854 RepID=A0A6P1YQT0_9HYPH|nr:hypothetical protein [Ancylobacter pratisalsi]QIB35046.1 hypothetical protein G3A50_16000 [Ancylobacter pratisalsi]